MSLPSLPFKKTLCLGLSPEVSECQRMVSEAVSRQCVEAVVEAVSIDTGVDGVEVCRPVSTRVDLCQRAD